MMDVAAIWFNFAVSFAVAVFKRNPASLNDHLGIDVSRPAETGSNFSKVFSSRQANELHSAAMNILVASRDVIPIFARFNIYCSCVRNSIIFILTFNDFPAIRVTFVNTIVERESI